MDKPVLRIKLTGTGKTKKQASDKMTEIVNDMNNAGKILDIPLLNNIVNDLTKKSPHRFMR